MEGNRNCTENKISELELERLIKEQKQRIREGEALFKKLFRPGIPSTDGREPPQKPKLQQLPINQLDAKHITLYLSLFVIGIMVLSAGIVKVLQNGGAIWSIFLIGVGSIVGAGAVMLAYIGWRTRQANLTSNEDIEAAYIKEMQRFLTESAQFQDYRELSLRCDETQLSLEMIYELILDHLKNRNEQTLQSLENALQDFRDFYQEGPITSQDMKAILSYLDGGLCNKLEESGEAYDTYDEENHLEQGVEFEGRQRPFITSFQWRGRNLKIMQVIHDRKYGRVLWVYLDHIKEYIIDGEIVKDQAIIDYLDDHYGRPVAERYILY